jgi:hypothetical protein
MNGRYKLPLPAVGTDSVTHGTFLIVSAFSLFDYDGEGEQQSVSSTVLIKGDNNPLFDAVKEHPLRLQGLISSVVFGHEKRFIKFTQLSDYELKDTDSGQEIDLRLMFKFLDNLDYLEQVVEYRQRHNL